MIHRNIILNTVIFTLHLEYCQLLTSVFRYKHMRILLLLFTVSILLSSCAETEDCTGFKLNQEFEIALNKTVRNCSENVSFTLLDIQDSRCPIAATCVWEGMIVLKGTFVINGASREIQLSNNPEVSSFPSQFSTSEYSIKLVDVVPFPNIDKVYDTKDQRAILIISERST